MEAGRRLRLASPDVFAERRVVSIYRVLLAQLESPLLLLLVFAAAVSALTREWVDAGLVLSIVIASVGIGAWREYKGQAAAAALTARIQTRATVVRRGAPQRIPTGEVVVGDIILLAAGSLVPADAAVLDASDCQVNEAVLTGEAFAVESGPVSFLPELHWRSASTRSIRAATCRAVPRVASSSRPGSDTEYGAIAMGLRLRSPETKFDRGLRQLRLPAHEDDADHHRRRLYGARDARALAHPDLAVRHRAGRGPLPGAFAGHLERQPRPRRRADGAPECWCDTSRPSRTSAAWTSCAPTRPAPSPRAWCVSQGAYDPAGARSSTVLELRRAQRLLRDRPAEPARRRHPGGSSRPPLVGHRAQARASFRSTSCASA